MIKPIKTKEQIRAEINAQVEAYLEHGGHVSPCKPGESGRESNMPLPRSPLVERSEPPQTRTPLVSEVQAIEARRKAKSPNRPNKRRSDGGKTLITDDFGEPLRWISD